MKTGILLCTPSPTLNRGGCRFRYMYSEREHMKKEVKAQLDNRENKSHIRSTEVIQVIKTVSFLGKGTDENPNRFIDQYWTLEGELLATVDPLMDSDADNLHFMKKLKNWSEPISKWINQSDDPKGFVVISAESFRIEGSITEEN